MSEQEEPIDDPLTTFHIRVVVNKRKDLVEYSSLVRAHIACIIESYIHDAVEKIGFKVEEIQFQPERYRISKEGVFIDDS